MKKKWVVRIIAIVLALLFVISILAGSIPGLFS